MTDFAVTIYGSSDDLIELEGRIYEEFYPEDGKPSYLAFSDGTVLEISYNGFWRINRLREGSANYHKIEGTDPVEDYSDRVTLSGSRIQWVVFGLQFAKAKGE